MIDPVEESSADVRSGALSADDLVVGFDGSPTSVDALALATPLARLWKVGIRVVTVHHPVVLGGHRSEDDRELAAARCARDGAARLGAGVRLSWGEHRAADVLAGLHAAAVTSAGLVVGRARHRVSVHGHRTVLEDAPVPVALARRHLLPHPALRHVVLGLTGEDPDALDVLLRFAGRLRHHQEVLVTVAGLDSAVGSGFLTDAVFEVGGVLGRRARGAALPARDAARRWDGDELVVCVGRARGAHGHQGADAVERILLAEDGPSLLVLPPRAAGIEPRSAEPPAASAGG